MKRNLPLILIAAVLAAAVAVTWVLYRSKQSGTATPFAAQTMAPPPIASPTRAAPAVVPPTLKELSPSAGPAVMVEEYGDYQCPPCGLLHPEMKKIVTEYGSRITFVFHNYPLVKVHKNALTAAQAVEAARLQGWFSQMHDLVYEKQKEWENDADPRPRFMKYARELGLDTQRLARDMDGPDVQQRLAEDNQRVEALKVSGTPTVFIDGHEMKPELTNGDGIRKGIDMMLARKAAGQQ